MPSILDRVPNETLLTISEFAIALDELPHSDRGRRLLYSTAVALSHVNQRLRDLITSTPWFWCNIHVIFPEYPYPAPSDWKPDLFNIFEVSDSVTDDYNRKFNILLRGVQTWVSRAGDRPLNLRIDAEPMLKSLLPYTLTEDDDNMISGLEVAYFVLLGL